MKLQLSREIVENLLQHNDESDSPANAEAWEVNALCRMMLAGMDSEPVAVPGHADCCPECGSKSLTWDVAVAKTSDVVQGRLRTSDVTGMFFLGCDECSETVSNVRMEDIAIFLNSYRAAMLKAGPVTAATVPDGWKLVPVEPTAEMQSAAAGEIRFETTPINKLWTGNAVYKAMLAAAPKAPEQEV